MGGRIIILAVVINGAPLSVSDLHATRYQLRTYQRGSFWKPRRPAKFRRRSTECTGSSSSGTCGREAAPTSSKVRFSEEFLAADSVSSEVDTGWFGFFVCLGEHCESYTRHFNCLYGDECNDSRWRRLDELEWKFRRKKNENNSNQCESKLNQGGN